MTTLLALNLKYLIFFCSNFKYYFERLAMKVTASKLQRRKVLFSNKYLGGYIMLILMLNLF